MVYPWKDSWLDYLSLKRLEQLFVKKKEKKEKKIDRVFLGERKKFWKNPEDCVFTILQ